MIKERAFCFSVHINEKVLIDNAILIKSIFYVILYLSVIKQLIYQILMLTYQLSVTKYKLTTISYQLVYQIESEYKVKLFL